MKIKVTDVDAVRRGFELWFDESLYESKGKYPRLNALGTRVMRVLGMHTEYGTQIYDPGNDTFGRCLIIEGAKSLKGFETREAAQRQMDKYAKVRLTAEFKYTKAFTVQSKTSPSRELKTPLDVKRAMAEGHEVRVGMLFLLNFPILPSDWEHLEPVLKREGMMLAQDDSDRRYAFAAHIVLKSDWRGKDPWTLMRDVQPKILATLAPLA